MILVEKTHGNFEAPNFPGHELRLVSSCLAPITILSIHVTRVPAASAFASLQRKSKVQHPSWVMSFSHCSIRSSCQSPDIKLCHIHMNFRPKRSSCCWHFDFGSPHGMSHPRPRPSRIVLVRPLGNVRSQVDSSSIIQSMVVFHLKSPWNSHKKFMSSYYQVQFWGYQLPTSCLCLSGQSLCLNALSIIFLWLHLGNQDEMEEGCCDP